MTKIYRVFILESDVVERASEPMTQKNHINHLTHENHHRFDEKVGLNIVFEVAENTFQLKNP